MLTALTRSNSCLVSLTLNLYRFCSQPLFGSLTRKMATTEEAKPLSTAKNTSEYPLEVVAISILLFNYYSN